MSIIKSTSIDSDVDTSIYSENQNLPPAYVQLIPLVMFDHMHSVSYPFHELTLNDLENFMFRLNEISEFPDYLYNPDEFPLARLTWRNIEFALHHYYTVYLREMNDN